MRVGLYELQIVDQDGVALPERCIDGRYYVEATPGQEFRVRSVIHRDTSGLFPVNSSAVILHIDGKTILHWIMESTDKSDSNSLNYTSNGGTYDAKSRQWHALKFAAANTDADYKESDESKTGEVRIEFFEKGVSAARPVQYCPLPVPVPEHNKPHKQPSLVIQPAHASSGAPPSDVCSWMNVRSAPDAVLTVKCHTASTINFLQFRHDQLAAARSAPHPKATNTSVVTVDLIGDGTPTVEMKPATAPAPQTPIDVDAETPVCIKEETKATGSSSSSTPPPDAFVSTGMDTHDAFDFAVPAGASSTDKPALRLKNRSTKSTKHKLKATAVHATLGTKRKAT